jgi:AcrR family transcriptional regulator
MTTMDTRLHPRERLLRTAGQLFYQEGIHAVGVDRLVREAGVTRATFYRHFPSKDDLVVAYLDSIDGVLHKAVDAETSTASPEQAVQAVFALVGRTVCAPGFRGCHFVNAAAEYPDAASPVRQAIQRHRDWFHDRIMTLAKAAGHPDPAYAAALCVILHDGGLSGGELDDPKQVAETVQRAVRDLLSTTASPAPRGRKR